MGIPHDFSLHNSVCNVRLICILFFSVQHSATNKETGRTQPYFVLRCEMFRAMLMFVYEYLNRGRQLMDTTFTMEFGDTLLILIEKLINLVYVNDSIFLTTLCVVAYLMFTGMCFMVMFLLVF